MENASQELLVGIVLLVALLISKFIDLVVKPVAFDYGVKLPDNTKKPVIFVALALVSLLTVFGLDLNYLEPYLDYSPFVTAVLSAAGLAGLATGQYDILKRVRGDGSKKLVDVLQMLQDTLTGVEIVEFMEDATVGETKESYAEKIAAKG
jgi:hypothetical protein